MKKSLLLLSVLFVLAFAFASCGAQGEKKEEVKSECATKTDSCDQAKKDTCEHAHQDTTAAAAEVK